MTPVPRDDYTMTFDVTTHGQFQGTQKLKKQAFYLGKANECVLVIRKPAPWVPEGEACFVIWHADAGVSPEAMYRYVSESDDLAFHIWRKWMQHEFDIQPDNQHDEKFAFMPNRGHRLPFQRPDKSWIPSWSAYKTYDPPVSDGVDQFYVLQLGCHLAKPPPTAQEQISLRSGNGFFWRQTKNRLGMGAYDGILSLSGIQQWLVNTR